ncbi:EAL domain-containing protein [Pseudomonas sp. FP1154]|uniref:bifunctional diguanylate cyclase/phosphodiesterase n=1 Tax=unclassified Pseudomonas TaxID=196821 RepID=UPI00248D0FF8|nr:MULTISPECIES: EAL domain-containing protein [unclassified Pseudomonas]MDR8386264.1 EAL domain-containing protein [Pseudomonas sp. JL2]WLG25346.1 EAL domain-containing protein [Pseudomonas sp. FP1154]
MTEDAGNDSTVSPPGLPSQSFTRRTFPAIMLLLFVMSALAIALLLSITGAQDRRAREQSLFFAQRAIDGIRAGIGRDLSDYSKWSDAYRHLHVEMDKDWAYDQENVGSSVFGLYGYQAVFVISPTGKTVYSVINGDMSEVDADTWLAGDLQGLAKKASDPQNRDEVIVELLHHDGAPAFVAASALTVGTDDSVPEIPGPPSLLLFVKVLDAASLQNLARDFALPDAHITHAPEQMDTARISLDGQTGEALAWRPETPGNDLRKALLPLLVLALLVLAILALAVLRHALVMLRAQERQYASLLAHRKALERSEERFRDIAEVSSDWLWEVDSTGTLTYLSERFEQVTGFNPTQWLGKPLHRLLHPHGGSISIAQWLLGGANSDSSAPLLCEYTARNQRIRTCKLSVRAIEAGTLGFRGTATDITEELRALAQIKHLSLHDPLTGLANRNRLFDCLSEHLDPADGAPLAVLNLDMDRFKPVNDSLGHAVGDKVLREVAHILQQNVRSSDLVARLGGDEFVIVMPDPGSPRDLEQLCERLIDCMQRPMHLDGNTLYLGVSIGVAWSQPGDERATELLRHADIALYAAKAAGRNTWRVYEEAMGNMARDRRRYEQQLRDAMQREQLELRYLPRFDVCAEQLHGFEAQTFWHHPEKGELGGADFIPIAEASGQLEELGTWMLINVCEEAVTWPTAVNVSVAVSPKWFSSSFLLNQVRTALETSGLVPQRLTLEVAEGVLLIDHKAVASTLHALKDLGVRINIDKFGTSIASLREVLNQPFDGIRFDRNILSQLGLEHDREGVLAMIRLSRSVGLMVTAEGIENARQFSQLRSVACDHVQGPYFGSALARSEMASFFTTPRWL